MKELLLNYWNDILAILAIIISAASFVQNRRLHNENKKLTVLPNLDISFLIDNRITGQIVRQNDGIDEFNIWKSKYSDYYTNHDVYLQENCKALFTVLISNVGMGVAKNIKFSDIVIYLKDCVASCKSKNILFTCSAGETKANKIYANYTPADVEKVEITIVYEDILGNAHTMKNCYEPIDERKSEMKLTQSAEQKRGCRI